MITCKNCGKELDESMEFCNECGTKLNGEKSINEIYKEVIKTNSKINLSKNQINLNMLSALSATIGLIFWCFGFYKYLSYDSGEYGDPVNAYVGGDAYNFIINGTYFAAFSVIGGVFVLGAFILYSANVLKNK